MKTVEEKIVSILVSSQETCKVGSDGDYSQEKCVFADDFEKVASDITSVMQLKELQHFKDSYANMFVTDKKPEDLFRIVFCDMIEKIGMDGNKTFSAQDFEYYESCFKKGVGLLFTKIK